MTIPTFTAGQVLDADALNAALGDAAQETLGTDNTWTGTNDFEGGSVTVPDATAAQNPVTLNQMDDGELSPTFTSLTAGTIYQAAGQGVNNETPFAQYGDLFEDGIVYGLTTSASTSLNGALDAGVAYIAGQRVVYGGGTYTVGASATSYLDLSNQGVLVVSTSSTVAANSLRLWEVVSGSSGITSVSPVATFQPSRKIPNFSGSNLTTTGVMISGSSTLTLSASLDFANGQGITVAGAGASGADLTAAQIVSGAGTTTLTLNVEASTTVSGATIYHDDTAAIQNALDAAASTFGEVVLPTGTPQISSTLNIPTGVALRGQSVQGTVIQFYDRSSTGNLDGFMIKGMDCTCPVLSNFTLQGPGISGYGGAGIYFGVINNNDVTGFDFNNLRLLGFPGTALYIKLPVAGCLSNILAQDFAGDGFNLYNGTSCTFSSCYALTGVGGGFKLQSMTYCSLSGCAGEGCGVDYKILNSNNITLNGCGSEVAQYRNSTDSGIHYGFSNSTGIVVNGGYARDFATPKTLAGSNQYINLSSSAKATFIGFRGISSTNSPTATYYVDGTSSLRLIDSQFDGLNDTVNEVVTGGHLSIEGPGTSSSNYMSSLLTVSATSTAGSITASASILVGGYFTDGATQTASFTVTTDTASNILAAMPNAIVGTAFKFRFINNDQSSTGYAGTLAGASGVTVGSVLPNPAVPKGGYMDYLCTFTAVGSSPTLTVEAVGGNSSGLL